MPKSEDLLSRLGEKAGDISLQCSETGGSLARLKQQIDAEAERLSGLKDNVISLDASQAACREAASELETTASNAQFILTKGNEVASRSLDRLAQLIANVGSLEDRLRALLRAIEDIEGVSKTIRQVAEESHMLGFNARIEAQRSGETGLAFGVIADKMRQLSKDTSDSAIDIDQKLNSLDTSARELITAVEGNIKLGKDTGSELDDLRGSFTELAALVTQFSGRSEGIVRSVVATESDAVALASGIVDFQQVAAATSERASDARAQLDRLEFMANEMFDDVAHSDLQTSNSPFVEMGLSGAKEVTEAIALALEDGGISEASLFSDKYLPVPGTQPVQYSHEFADFADEVIRPMLDRHTSEDVCIVGCCLVDRRGYLPTHISERSKPQRNGDPLWNKQFSRNRQIFTDNHIQRALEGEGEYFVYTYRQDLGAGNYRALRSVLVPLHFAGKRWGLYELGYRF